MPRIALERKTSIAAATLLTMFGAPAAQAALPPYWQSAKEIEAIVGDQSVHDAFKYEEPIVSIKLQEPVSDNRVYEVTTPRCSVLVTIVPKPAKLVGPAAFDLQIGEATCK